MKLRSFIAISLFALAILAFVAFLVTLFVRSLLPSEMYGNLFLLVAILLAVAGFLAALNNIIELFKKLFASKKDSGPSSDVALPQEQPVSEWRITPHDFGIDPGNGRHIIGFRIEPQINGYATLEALWTCEESRDDTVVLWHHINATSRNLKNPSSGQFMVAVRFAADSSPRFMMTMENGFYARFNLSRYYRARIFIRDQSHLVRKCIDVIIHSMSPVSSRENGVFEVAGIEDADCKDTINPPLGMEDAESKTWATESVFKPNQWQNSQM